MNDRACGGVSSVPQAPRIHVPVSSYMGASRFCGNSGKAFELCGRGISEMESSQMGERMQASPWDFFATLVIALTGAPSLPRCAGRGAGE